MWQCHVKYGNKVRYAPKSLLFNTATGIHDIYRFGSSSAFIKGKEYEPMIHRAPNTLTISGGREHARRRRILLQGVSERALRNYKPRLMSHILTLAKVVASNAEGNPRDREGRRWGFPVNMGNFSSYLSFDIMADVIFDAKYNLLEQPQFRFLGGMLSIRLKRLSQSGHDEKDADGKTGYLFNNLAVATDPETGSRFTADELAAESATLVIAGTDTFSTSLAAVLFYLAYNPACYARAAAEVRGTFGKGRLVSGGPGLTSCVYLRACIEEALRMSPPVGGSLWREVATENGATVDNEHIPRGATVGVSIYSIQHSKAYFDEPFTYNPDRWLVNGAGDVQKVERARSVFVPFSIGPRSCLGKGLAMHELILTMATLLNMGDFKLPDGNESRAGCGKAGAKFGRHREGDFQLKDFITRTEGRADFAILHV